MLYEPGSCRASGHRTHRQGRKVELLETVGSSPPGMDSEGLVRTFRSRLEGFSSFCGDSGGNLGSLDSSHGWLAVKKKCGGVRNTLYAVFDGTPVPRPLGPPSNEIALVRGERKRSCNAIPHLLTSRDRDEGGEDESGG